MSELNDDLLILDNVCIPLDGSINLVRLLCASKYYPSYLRFKGTLPYQSYIQYTEKYLDRSGTLLASFIRVHLNHFLEMCEFSNNYWGKTMGKDSGIS